MGAVEQEDVEVEVEVMCSSRESLVEEVGFLYNKISEQESLHPSEEVNALFSRLVGVCLRPGSGSSSSSSLDMEELDKHTQEMRAHLIVLCGQAEGLLESHYSKLLGTFTHPLSHLPIFPYYSNYRKLALLEYQLLCNAKGADALKTSKLAFLGSGPLPLTSLVLALHHLPFTHFDNFDIDPQANLLAQQLVSSHASLSHRMAFHTCNVNKLQKRQLAQYEVVFLAALVGLDTASKMEFIQHLAKYMKAGAILVVRSAHGARAFLYPIVDQHMLQSSGFEVVSVFHPSDEVVNSVIIARRLKTKSSSEDDDDDDDDDHDDDHDHDYDDID